MHKHAKNCWGEDIVSQALETKGSLTIDEVCKSLAGAKVQNGSIFAAFERKGKGVVTFSTRQHTYEETRLKNKFIDSFYLKITVCRVECVRWVAESMRPMTMINDPAFHRLMKTGRPQYRLPSSRTTTRDGNVVFHRVKERIARMLQVSIVFF